MGVAKINWHKRTRFGKTGFRQALCLHCGQWVYVMSYQDDTRWRYGRHRRTSSEALYCEGYGELLPAETGS